MLIKEKGYERLSLLGPGVKFLSTEIMLIDNSIEFLALFAEYLEKPEVGESLCRVRLLRKLFRPLMGDARPPVILSKQLKML